MIVDLERNVIVSMTLVGPGVGELIHAATIAVVGAVPIDRLWPSLRIPPSVKSGFGYWRRLDGETTGANTEFVPRLLTYYLSFKQNSRLGELLKLNSTLNAVYVLKEQLKAIYIHTSRPKAQAVLSEWCRMAFDINHPEMRKYIKRLQFFEYGILNHCEHPIGTSKLEGVNNKIKVIKRKAYGFQDERYFALKIKQAFHGNSIG